MGKYGGDAFVLVALTVLGLLVAAKLDRQAGPDFHGPLRAVDGDTLAAGRERLRLAGLDAPERAQTCGGNSGMRPWPCGEAARLRLAVLAGDPQLSCRAQGRDRYRRVLVVCRGEGGRGADIAAVLVGEGLAIASDDHYLEEAGARVAARGIWSGAFERPASSR
jgi:endonuclease YncB( thermonuclease family)